MRIFRLTTNKRSGNSVVANTDFYSLSPRTVSGDGNIKQYFFFPTKNPIFDILRLCATKQLFEQVSCDEPDTDDTVDMVEREKLVWESPVLNSKNKIVGNRVSSGGKAELKAHEEDIKVRYCLLL